MVGSTNLDIHYFSMKHINDHGEAQKRPQETRKRQVREVHEIKWEMSSSKPHKKEKEERTHISMYSLQSCHN